MGCWSWGGVKERNLAFAISFWYGCRFCVLLALASLPVTEDTVV